MDERERRLATNEALFREVNERIQELAGSFGDDEHGYEFVCECANRDCTFRIELTVRDYERVRRDPHRFLVKPGHHFPEVEEVVERHERVWVVEKRDEAAELAERLDSRDRER